MFDFYSAPFVPEVLGDEAAVAVMRFLFAAQETTTVQCIGRDLLFYVPRLDEFQEPLLVERPVTLVPFEGRENIRGRGEHGEMYVFNATDLFR